jgi:hypothetical protein
VRTKEGKKTQGKNERRKKRKQKGVDEFKKAKIDVKTSTFLQFLLYLSMWCHFNGM